MEKIYTSPESDDSLTNFDGAFPDAYALYGSDGAATPDVFSVNGVSLSPFETTSMPTAATMSPAEIDACDITTKPTCQDDCDPDNPPR